MANVSAHNIAPFVAILVEGLKCAGILLHFHQLNNFPSQEVGISSVATDRPQGHTGINRIQLVEHAGEMQQGP